MVPIVRILAALQFHEDPRKSAEIAFSEMKSGMFLFTEGRSGSPVPPGATDDLAAELAMNPAMKVMIVHGVYDLVTPYFESKYLAQHLAQNTSVGMSRE